MSNFRKSGEVAAGGDHGDTHGLRPALFLGNKLPDETTPNSGVRVQLCVDAGDPRCFVEIAVWVRDGIDGKPMTSYMGLGLAQVEEVVRELQKCKREMLERERVP